MADGFQWKLRNSFIQRGCKAPRDTKYIKKNAKNLMEKKNKNNASFEIKSINAY